MTSASENKKPEPAGFKPGAMDIMALVGLALIGIGVALVNIPMALFTVGVLLYTPAIIAELR